MDVKEVAILIAVAIFVGFRIYQKYFRKDSGSKGKLKDRDDLNFKSNEKDDYEPYRSDGQ